jgi:hypothetical protein
MKTPRHASFLACSLLTATLAFEAVAAAQSADPAEVLFNRGLTAMEKGRYSTGCPDLAESQRLEPLPGTLFTLATCEDRWGHSATAVAKYSEYLAVYDRIPEARKAVQGERPKLARAQRDKLAVDVPELTLTLAPGVPAGIVVKRDGQVVAAAALGIGLQVDPGEHTISTVAPGGNVRERLISIGKGEKKKLTLEIRDVASAPPDASAAEPGAGSGASGRRVATYVIGGVGVAGLVLGGVMGGLTFARKGIFNQHCGSGIQSSDATACDPTGLDAVSSGKTFGLVSTLGFAVGLAGVGTAVVLLVTEAKPPLNASRMPGRGISVGILSIGPAGATVGAQGAW